LHTQREAGLRSMVAARSEGGGVEIDGCSATMTKSLRKRTAAAHSEAGDEAAVCTGAGDDVAACSRAGIKDGRW
jgi:hypothetical protein